MEDNKQEKLGSNLRSLNSMMNGLNLNEIGLSDSSSSEQEENKQEVKSKDIQSNENSTNNNNLNNNNLDKNGQTGYNSKNLIPISIAKGSINNNQNEETEEIEEIGEKGEKETTPLLNKKQINMKLIPLHKMNTNRMIPKDYTSVPRSKFSKLVRLCILDVELYNLVINATREDPETFIKILTQYKEQELKLNLKLIKKGKIIEGMEGQKDIEEMYLSRMEKIINDLKQFYTKKFESQQRLEGIRKVTFNDNVEFLGENKNKNRILRYIKRCNLL